MPVDRRDEDQRSEIDKREFTVNLIAVGFCILGVSRHQIPLVYGENQPLSTLKGIGQDLRILVGYPFGPIQEVNHQIPPVHGAEGPDHAIILNPIVDSSLAANSGGVHQGIPLAFAARQESTIGLSIKA